MVRTGGGQERLVLIPSAISREGEGGALKSLKPEKGAQSLCKTSLREIIAKLTDFPAENGQEGELGHFKSLGQRLEKPKHVATARFRRNYLQRRSKQKKDMKI